MARELENADPHILSSPNFVGGESIGKLLRKPLLLETYARSRSSTERRWRRDVTLTDGRPSRNATVSRTT